MIDDEGFVADWVEKAVPLIREKVIKGFLEEYKKVVPKEVIYACGCIVYSNEPWLFCATHGEGISGN